MDREQILDDVRREYAKRTERFDSFSPRQRQLFDLLTQRQHQQFARMFRKHGLLPLGDRKVLDVGSGRNEWLVTCHDQWGHTGADLCGVELMPDRVADGLARYPYMKLVCGSADAIPWPDDTFDLVFQGMLLTSILDEALSRRIVGEMRRVTRPGGMVLWYDFVWNPRNKAARGIPLAEVRDYFAGWEMVDRARVTLAPPLARRLARIGQWAIDVAESLRILNFWQLVLLRKPS